MPKKSFGQHFLINKGVVAKMIAAVDPLPSDHILEIGPGPGVLTDHLVASGARVTAVDADHAMITALQEKHAVAENLTLVHADILQYQPPTTGVYKVVGNIPYNISSPIFFWLAEHRAHISSAVLTIQKEVAQRLIAKPGTKDYGALTVGMQAVANIERLFHISPGSFWPVPKVTSSTIRIIFPSPPPYDIPDAENFRATVRTAFQKRRKMLRNSFTEKQLMAANIDPTRRPDTLTIEEFVALAAVIRL